MGNAAINAIDTTEPYQGGKGHSLWVLHKLNNIDKHRLLITVGSAYRSFNVGAVIQQASRSLCIREINEQSVACFERAHPVSGFEKEVEFGKFVAVGIS